MICQPINVSASSLNLHSTPFRLPHIRRQSPSIIDSFESEERDQSHKYDVTVSTPRQPLAVSRKSRFTRTGVIHNTVMTVSLSSRAKGRREPEKRDRPPQSKRESCGFKNVTIDHPTVPSGEDVTSTTNEVTMVSHTTTYHTFPCVPEMTNYP